MHATCAASTRRRGTPGGTLLALAVLLSFLKLSALGAAPQNENAGIERGMITGRVQHEVTGRSLHNARVAVKGTNRIAFTDESGVYRLPDVPSGPAVLQVFYTQLTPVEIPVNVPSGGTVEMNVGLTNVTGIGTDANVVKLDPFVVEASNETSAEALAVNEQRFAPNIKNVVGAGAFGDVSQGNIGEFIKYLPSITADFADPTMKSISVRGLPSSLTQVTYDGSQLASAHTGGSTRVFQFDQVSINNISRVELTKVPSPSDPADTLGGVVNLVSKSAFELKKAQLNYRAYLTARQGNVSAKKLPDPHDGWRYRVLPNVDFTYNLPVNDRFGLVVSGLSANSYDDRHVAARTYNATLANSGASYSNPFMQSFTLQEAPRFMYRNSGSIKAEWRVTPHGVLSARAERSTFREFFGMNQLVATTGGTAAPVAGGEPLSFGPDFTHGATGRGGMTLNGQFFDIRGATNVGSARYQFDDGTWMIKAGLSESKSTMDFTDFADGHFYNMTTQLFSGAGFVGSPFTVNYDNIGHTGPQRFEVLDGQGRPVDISDSSKYRITAAASVPRYVTDKVEVMDLSVRRRISRLSFPLAVEMGAARRAQKRDVRMHNAGWTYNGPDGKSSTSDPSTPYLAYLGGGADDAGFGFKQVPWVSNTKAFAAWKADPGLFTQTTAQEVAAEKYRIGHSEAFEEIVSAGYFELDARLLENRLRVLTGVRYERTVGKGLGALSEPSGVYQRNADGSFAHDTAGKLIRKPEAGAPGSMEEVRVTLFERQARAKRSYDGFYPSLHLTYDLSSNMLARFAYARTYGRPNFNQIIPNVTINDFDTADNSGGLPGTINVRNPGLRPWVADNFDLSLEYYTKKGGLYSVGAYRKDIDGYFESSVSIATAGARRAVCGLPDHDDLQPRRRQDSRY